MLRILVVPRGLRILIARYFDQTFVLRKPESDEEEGDGDEDRYGQAWLLEVLLHQMTVREVPLLSFDGGCRGLRTLWAVEVMGLMSMKTWNLSCVIVSFVNL